MINIIAILLLFIVPVLVLILCKKVSFLNKIGPITICYFLGFLFSLIPFDYDKNTTQLIASILVALAIPLILFGFNIKDVKKLAKKTIISFSLVIVSVIVVSSVVSLIAAKKCDLEDANKLAGMATGLYIGGTPNLFAIGQALGTDNAIINSANISDCLVGGVYFMLVLSVIKLIYKKVLKGKKEDNQLSNEEVNLVGEYDYKSIPRDKKSIFKLIGVILLAVASLGLGAGLELLINGSLDGSLFILITVSVLGIVFSLIKPVRETKGSYQIGQFLILVFSFGLSMSIDFKQLVDNILPTFIFFTCVQLGSIFLHFILCWIFKIDGGTALVTSIAGIFGPPFIAPTANAYNDRSLILPGVICGTLGLISGNIIGIGLGSLLGIFI